MSYIWGVRERLIWRATKLGLKFEASISDNALRNMIDASTATPKQMQYIEAFLKPLNRKPPKGLTFKQAREIIDLMENELNEHAIRTMKLESGQVRAWNNSYYMIVNIWSDRKAYRIRVQEVKLTRGKGTEKATTTPIGDERTISPYWMGFVSYPVDLAKWPPPKTPVSHDFDDSPF